MRVNSRRIRSEREKRAWSQEHLANVSGLGVRTIHRIENTGSASLESVKALASVFELEISELKDSGIAIPKELSWPKLLWVLLNSPVKLILENESRKTNLLRLLTMTACLLGALGSYVLGTSTGIGAFIFVAVFLDIALWFKLTEGSRSS